MTLPRSLDQLHGLRAARWIRESTTGQFDAFGPDAQREQQDRAIERYGPRRPWVLMTPRRDPLRALLRVLLEPGKGRDKGQGHGQTE